MAEFNLRYRDIAQIIHDAKVASSPLTVRYPEDTPLVLDENNELAKILAKYI